MSYVTFCDCTAKQGYHGGTVAISETVPLAVFQMHERSIGVGEGLRLRDDIFESASVLGFKHHCAWNWRFEHGNVMFPVGYDADGAGRLDY